MEVFLSSCPGDGHYSFLEKSLEWIDYTEKKKKKKSDKHWKPGGVGSRKRKRKQFTGRAFKEFRSPFTRAFCPVSDETRFVGVEAALFLE